MIHDPDTRRRMVAAIVRGMHNAARDSGDDWGIMQHTEEWFSDPEEEIREFLRHTASDVWWNFDHVGDPDYTESDPLYDRAYSRASAMAADRIVYRAIHWIKVVAGSAPIYPSDLQLRPLVA